MNTSMVRFTCVLLGWAVLCGPVFAGEPAPDITDHYRRMMIYHRYMDGNVPEDAVLFIGDSITQGLCVAAVSERAVNYGIGSDTTVGVLERLPAYRSMERAAAVVIAIGVNDLSRRDNEAILENYGRILEATPADTPLIFSAVLPLDERVERIEEGRNARIRALNDGLRALCDAHDRVRYVDVTAALADDTGSLSPAHHVGDGVHLNTAGYTHWIQALQEALSGLAAGTTP